MSCEDNTRSEIWRRGLALNTLAASLSGVDLSFVMSKEISIPVLQLTMSINDTILLRLGVRPNSDETFLIERS